MSAIKTILLSQVPLPYHKTGSWTTMYNYYLSHKDHQIDYIICETSENPIQTIVYQELRMVTVLDKIKNKKTPGKRFSNYFEALQKIVKPNQKYMLQIVDNSGLIVPLHHFIKEHFNRQHFYIQYFYHGFEPILSDKIKPTVINEMIFLTKLSYQAHLNKYEDFVIPSAVLHNGVNEKLFYKVSPSEKEKLKQENDVAGKLVFIWCSQDRPKKGLDFILMVWKHIYKKHGDKVVLQVVGTKRDIQQAGVINIGRVPNTDLPKYYQMSDVYLFPSLWKEGFGIVLAEALRCGCYCIASNQGGIPEVLQFGKYGTLVDFPNNIKAWIAAIEESIVDFKMHNGENKYAPNIPEALYSITTWSKQLNNIIADAKFLLNN